MKLTREETIRIFVKNSLKDILRCAKKGRKYCANEYINQLEGAIYYMWVAEDITEESYERIKNLIRLIEVRYKV